MCSASVDVLTLYYCLALHDCIYPYCLQWVLVIAILSTSLSACVLIVLLSCFVLLNCLELYYWIVYLHIPLSLQWVLVSLFSSPTCLLVCLYFSCRKDDLFCLAIVYYSLWHCVLTLCIITCILPLTLTFIPLLPQLLRAVAPALTLIPIF